MNRTGAEWFCRKTFPMPQLVRVQLRPSMRPGSTLSLVLRRTRFGRTLFLA